ncbi:cubilin-like [Penaeus indicus]|uniref:cubilin-like n=1 Tax=Penaeus indicus TaxID=29960 RepID=UPI00300DA941
MAASMSLRRLKVVVVVFALVVLAAGGVEAGVAARNFPSESPLESPFKIDLQNVPSKSLFKLSLQNFPSKSPVPFPPSQSGQCALYGGRCLPSDAWVCHALGGPAACAGGDDVCCDECPFKTRSQCLENNGICKSSCAPDEQALQGGCRGDGCICCATCRITPRCQTRGGSCVKSVAECPSGLVDSAACEGDQCIWNYHAVASNLQWAKSWNYHAVASNLQWEINTTYGVISMGSEVSLYENNLDCEWRIEVRPGHQLTLVWLRIDIEKEDVCGFDFVELEVQEKIGFSGDLMASYLPVYEDNMDCEWRVTTPKNSLVRFHFESFGLEDSTGCGFDYLELEDLSVPGLILTGSRLCGSEVPDDIYSFSNQVVVRFHSDSSVTSRGFVLHFDAVFAQPPPPPLVCNGTYGMDGLSGYIRPTYNDTYENFMDCEWRVATPRNSLVHFHFEIFDLENSTGCGFDYLELEDLSMPGFILAGGRLCGSEVPDDFYSFSNQVVVRFHSDSIVVGRGFVLHFETVFIPPLPPLSSCNGTYEMNSIAGSIRPSYNGTYENSMDCEWRVTMPGNLLVRFHFESFDLEDSTDCVFDYLELEDLSVPGLNLTGGRLCGSEVPDDIYSVSNQVVVRFHSDSSVVGSGFALYYEVEQRIRQHQADLYLTSDHGFITHGPVNASYMINMDCEWRVTTPEGTKVVLEFFSFDLEADPECRFDYLEVEDLATGLSLGRGRMCGTDLPGTIQSISNQVVVRFHSDSSVVGRGFDLVFSALYSVYTTTPASTDFCNGSTALDLYFGTISPTPNSLPYDNNMDCEWTLTTPEGTLILFHFLSFDLEYSEDCVFDYLELEDLSRPGQYLGGGRLCGSEVPDDIYSFSNQVVVRFRSDSSVVGPGFVVSFDSLYHGTRAPSSTRHTYWSEILPTGFSTGTWEDTTTPDETTTSGESTTPDEWTTPGEWTFPETLPARSSTRQTYWPEILPTGSLTETWVDTTTPAPLCAAHSFLTAPSGTVSASSASSYPNGLSCEWEVVAPEDATILFAFVAFDVESCSSCSCDYVELLDAAAPGRPLGGSRLCGAAPPAPLASLSNRVRVRFVTDSSVGGKGFELRYEFVNAGTSRTSTPGLETTTTSAFTTRVWYDTTTPAPLCAAHSLLTAPSGTVAPEDATILFAFVAFDVESCSSCSCDYVELLDAAAPARPLGGSRLCGAAPPAPLASLSNRVRVRFVTDSSVGGKGFELRYEFVSAGTSRTSTPGLETTTTSAFTTGVWYDTTTPAPLCAAHSLLTAPSGTVSASSTSSYPNGLSCEWEVVAPEDATILFAFVAFDVESCSSCSCDYVELLDAAAPGQPLGGSRLCGAAPPAPLASLSNRVRVRFVTDSSVGGKGFELRYEFVSAVLTAPSGTVSASSTSSYPNGLSCEWEVVAPEDATILFAFVAFDVESCSSCSCDYVELLDAAAPGQPLGGSRLCGAAPPAPLASLSNRVRVRFVTDSSVGGKGFELRYEFVSAGTSRTSTPGLETTTTSAFTTLVWIDTTTPAPLCAAHSLLTAPSGTVSASSASSYPNGLSCEWEVVAPEDATILFAFVAFDVESCSSCSCDYVELLDAAAPGQPLGGSRLCGAAPPAPLASLSNRVRVRFVTDSSVGGKGFELRYEFVSAGTSRTSTPGLETTTTSAFTTGVWIDTTTPAPLCAAHSLLTAPSGTVSASSASSYPNGLSCEWEVVAPEDATILFAFVAFDVESCSSCSCDYVELLDAAALARPLGGSRLCGAAPPAPLASLSNRVRVRFVTDSSVGGKGFELRYEFVSAGILNRINTLHNKNEDFPRKKVRRENKLAERVEVTVMLKAVALQI